MDRISSAPYTQIQRISVILGEEQVELITKPGLPKWDIFSPTTNLLIENADIQPGDSILLYGGHLGVLAVYLTRRYPLARIFATDHLHTSLEMTRQTLEVNHVESVYIIEDIEIPAHLENFFNIIYIQIPKGRLLARRWLLQAYRALVEGGKLYIGGSNKTGIQSVIKDGRELFGSDSVLAYKKGNRVALFVKKLKDVPDVEWAVSPGIATGTWFEFTIKQNDQIYRIRSLPGVFSYDRLDDGTKMLLSATTIPSGSRVLDVGCGYGIIGLYAAQHGASFVDLVDNDLLATASCAATLSLNGVFTAQVYQGDLLDSVSNNDYDIILSNPPFHSGHQVDFQITEALIAQSQRALHSGGRLIIVSNRFIRYDYLIKAIFGNVALLAQSGKYHVLSGLKSR